jgi:high-affinity iron transporter
MMKLRWPGLLFSLLLAASPAWAEDADWQETARTALHLLDYIGADYPEFVQDGAVLDAAEYQEQLEFAAQVLALLPSLPERPQRPHMLADAQALLQLIEARGPAMEVTALTARLRWDLIGAYSLVVTPRHVPDLTRGKALYAESCAGCHGAAGRGDGPVAAGLSPAPTDFTDATRNAQRSTYSLYNTITLGVGGTGMAGYAGLSDDDRWALAYHVASLGSTPGSLAATTGSPIEFTIAKLRESQRAQRSGDPAGANQLALTAYLEGFELAEASLDAVDGPLRTQIEREMMAYRTLLVPGTSTEAVERQLDTVTGLLQQAGERLEKSRIGPGAAFTSSLLILLREGLEAILVLAAIIAFLVKSGRRDALPWVHVGWVAALVAGAATWFVATYVVAISGASREMTEAVSALGAAAVLVYVGVWLHSNASGQAWQSFVQARVGSALGRRTLWALAAVSFLAVYRELFEIVLFYQALWARGGTASGAPLLAGMSVAVLALALIGGAIFRYGLRLPIARFFTLTAIALAVLAVIFVGQGVAALQEAGAVGVQLVSFIRLPALGIFPTAQTLAAQLAVSLLLLAGFFWVGRNRPVSLRPTR